MLIQDLNYVETASENIEGGNLALAGALFNVTAAAPNFSAAGGLLNIQTVDAGVLGVASIAQGLFISASA